VPCIPRPYPAMHAPLYLGEADVCLQYVEELEAQAGAVDGKDFASIIGLACPGPQLPGSYHIGRVHPQVWHVRGGGAWVCTRRVPCICVIYLYIRRV
jgi:hypothetical protein